jgi:formylglycine-generating enzyme
MTIIGPLFTFIKYLFKFLLFFFKNKIVLGFLFALVVFYGASLAIHETSTDEFCEACHVHPHSTQSWKTSPHYDNSAGIVVHCVDCHLPPGGLPYLTEKAKTGTRDVYGKLFTDIDKINWDEKSKLEHATKHVYNESCINCHQSLFPMGLSKKGEDAHLYHNNNVEKLQCVNCHLKVGHFSKKEQEAHDVIVRKPPSVIYKKAAFVTEFETFTEFIPNTGTSFKMVAIPGGTFTMGSPDNESLRENDEGPQIIVKLSSFFMGKVEVTWDEYETFMYETKTEGRSDTRPVVNKDVDTISGPTPAYEDPGQGWGREDRPAMTMTFHAANVYCQWLTKVTGKNYRLPTEAEWEYAARGGTETPYYFEGDPKKFTKDRFWNKVFGVDTTGINSNVHYILNSSGKNFPAGIVGPNPYGLLNMPGNVREFCSDWYAADAFAQYPPGSTLENPMGPQSGTERVVRGGSYKSDAADVRSAARDFTQHNAWMVTDPQIPKSSWWYSDAKDVGFRVVCEWEDI